MFGLLLRVNLYLHFQVTVSAVCVGSVYETVKEKLLIYNTFLDWNTQTLVIIGIGIVAINGTCLNR